MTVEELQVLITASTKELRDELNSTKLELNKFEKKVNSSTTKIANFFKKMIPIGAVVLGIKKLASASEQAYKDQIQNETRLLAVMTRLSEATNDDVKDIFRLTEAEQAYGVIADEVQLAGAQELATYIDKADSIKKLIPQLNNMLAQQYGYNASQEEAINIATMMGKVLEGQTGALSRYGYYFDENQEKILKFGTEEQKVATLTEIIHDSIGDVNQALGDTAVGKQIQLANAWSDVKEQLGYVIVQVKQVLVPVFQVLVSWLGTAVSFLRQFLQLLGFTAKKQSNANKAIIGGASAEKSYGDAVEDTTKKQKEQLSSFDEMNVLKEDTASDNSSGGGAGDGVSGGINNIDFNVGIDGDVEVTERVAAMAEQILEFIQPVIDIFDIFKQFALDIADSLQHWVISDGFQEALKRIKQFITDIFNIVNDVAQWFLQMYEKYFKPVIDDKLLPAINDIIIAVSDVWNAVKPVIDKVIEQIKKYVEPIIKNLASIIGNIIDVIRGIAIFVSGVFTGDWQKAWSGIKMIVESVWSAIWTVIKNVINTIINAVEKMCNTVINGLNKIISPLAKIGNTILEVVGIKSFSFSPIPNVSLPRLAQGGVVDKPTLAEVGENGKEAIMPLERNTEWIDDLASKITTAGGGQPMHITFQIGDDVVIDKFIDDVQRKSFETNGEVVFSL